MLEIRNRSTAKKDLCRLQQLSPGMRVNTRYINSTRGTFSSLYLHACQVGYRRQLTILLLCLCYRFRALINLHTDSARVLWASFCFILMFSISSSLPYIYNYTSEIILIELGVARSKARLGCAKLTRECIEILSYAA